MGFLISETTREEREKIVSDSLGYIDATCDGCMSGLVDMYQDYIDGKRELRDINMAFHAGYISGDDIPGRNSCPIQGQYVVEKLLPHAGQCAGQIGEQCLDTVICVKYNTTNKNK